jgi:glycosyltransferase involved in cell wall biosynthesis
VARPVVAILPWGEVIEDFLDGIDLTLDDFLETMSGGWLFGYVEALRRTGVGSVIVCTTTAVDRPTRRTHEPTGAPVWLLPAGRALRRLRTRPAGKRVTPWLATPPRALASVLRREAVGAVLCQEYSEARFTVCLAVGRGIGVPVFATFQGGVDGPTTLERWTRRPSMRRGAGFVVGSRPEAERIRDRYGIPDDRIHRIPNPLDIAEWPAGDRTDARQALGIADGDVVVAWHGRIEIHRKGIDVLLDAWDRFLPAGGARKHLLMVGTGPDADRVHARVDGRDDVAWTDAYMLDRSLIRRHLAAADVAVLPSRHEGFPVALLEMMASARPVVTSEVPGVRDVAPGGEAEGCVVVPIGDAAAIADAFSALAADAPRRAALAVAARQRVEAGFSFETVGRSLAVALALEAD